MKAQMATAKQVSKCQPQVQNTPCDSAVEGRDMKAIREGSAQDATQSSAAPTAGSEVSLSGGREAASWMAPNPAFWYWGLRGIPSWECGCSW